MEVKSENKSKTSFVGKEMSGHEKEKELSDGSVGEDSEEEGTPKSSAFKPKKALVRSPPVAAMQSEKNIDKNEETGSDLPVENLIGSDELMRGDNSSTVTGSVVLDNDNAMMNLNDAEQSIVEIASTSQSSSAVGESTTEREYDIEQCAFPKIMLGRQNSAAVNPGASPRMGKGRQRINSVPPDTEEIVTSKRKNEMSPIKTVTKKGKTGIMAAMQRLEANLMLLSQQIQDQATVKRETKQQMLKVNECMMNFKKEYEREQQTQAERKNVPQPEMEALEFRERIESAKMFEEVKEIVQRRWPSGCFKNTRVSNRSKNYDEESTIYSVLLYPEMLEEDKNFIALKEKIPAIRVITEEKLRERGFVPVRQEEETAIEGFESGSKRKLDVLIAAAILSRKKEPLEIADLINWADRLKLQAESSERSKVSVAFPEDEELDVIRKVFECRLAGSMVTVQLVVNDKRKIPNRAVNDAITIDGGASYAEILKSVKEGVSLEDVGVQVKKIQKTQAGAMRLSVVETTPGGRQKLLQKIEEALPKEANIRVAVQTKCIIITDIEEDVEADEVKSALAAEVGVECGSIRLSQFRMSMRGTKSVTAFLPTVAAENAIKMKRMKLGWTSCLIRERIDPPLCGKWA